MAEEEESKLEAVVGVNIKVVVEMGMGVAEVANKQAVGVAEKAQQQVEEKALGLEEKVEEVMAMKAQKACT
ncbi:hypothetical protein RJ641_026108 [Dillenia turbinata]|uniref:Uncharacterized protein n=1 Tax=Dillenia turbinata TaxID=194707 RepID=A0AAN8WAH4_9MAGN